MNQIAVCIGNTFIYWSSVIIFLGIAACFALTYSLYTSHGGRGSALWLLLPLALLHPPVPGAALVLPHGAVRRFLARHDRLFPGGLLSPRRHPRHHAGGTAGKEAGLYPKSGPFV